MGKRSYYSYIFVILLFLCCAIWIYPIIFSTCPNWEYIRLRTSLLLSEAIPNYSMEFRLDTTWDGDSVNYEDIIVTLEGTPNGVTMEVSAPFFNSPEAPPGKPGEPFFKLWDYEVVEAFFLGAHDRYLEVELGPHGHHLLLFLDGEKNSIKHSLPLNYTAEINDDFWKGKAEIPASYFPPDITKFNAYAIHGFAEKRIYQSLYPTPKGKYQNPDFHRLNYFRPIAFDRLLPSNKDSCLSQVWKDAMH